VPAGDDRVRADGTRELIALDDGHGESTESWLDLLRGCKRRGMAAPVLAVGHGTLGFWSAVCEVFPELTRQPLACCSPIALPARRRRACRLRDTRFRSR
jgi:transposase-like protein